MSQINFRIEPELKGIFEIIAKSKGKSVAQMAKEAVLNLISNDRVDLAFKLLEEGKIGRKDAWKISGLEYGEFLKEWSERKAEENIIRTSPEDELKILKDFIESKEFTKYLKKKN